MREFRQASAPFPIIPLPGLEFIAAPDETGDSFAANAVQKAVYYGAHTSGLLFAEDSGLEADGLNGAPGIYSARFAGPGATDAANNALLLARLAGVSNRRARYRCAIALVEAGRLLATFEGAVEGEIIQTPRGTGGFGYDPLFYYPPYARTFAECTAGEKFAVSHRARALALMMAYLERTASAPGAAGPA